MVRRWVRVRRAALGVAVVGGWLLVMVGAALPNSAGATSFQHLALAVATCVAAVVTLLAARQGPSRRAWLLLGLGLSGYAAGFVIQFWVTAGEHGGPGGLNLSDCASLLLYPFADAGLLVLSRQRAGRRDSGSLLEGGMVFAGVSAFTVAVVSAAYPSLLEGSVLHVVYALAYPAGGFTLLVVTLTGLALTGGRGDRVWLLLVVGFVLMTVGDALYGLASVAGRFRFGTYLDVLYTAGPVFVALAATYSPSISTAAARQWRASSALPGLATLTALAVLVAGSYTVVPMLSVWAAAVCVVLAVCRTSQLFAQGRALDRSRIQARTDELTGLANRRALLEAMEAGAREAPLSPDRPLELLLLDLDGFKEVNDSLGHTAGDELLTLIGAQLRKAATGCMVARLGGDEFAVLLPRAGRRDIRGLTGPPLATALRAVVDRPALVARTRVVVGVSVGHAALISDDEANAVASVSSELLRRADVALYRAKKSRSGCVTWHASLDQGSRDRLALLSELRAALLDDDQIHTWYQPKIDPRDGKVQGYEALVRWSHPTRGLLLPGDFVAAAERAGLLPELTLRVLEQALALLRELLSIGRNVHLAVNLGAPDLLDPDLPTTVARLLAKHDVPPQHLRLEVTETVVMSDPDRIIATLRGLRALGVGLSLDDYGTGLSSLGYLRVLPVDELKIDRSFVRDLLTDQSCALIVSSTIGLAHDLCLRVVAEGVEDQLTLEALATAGCDTVQGWHTGRPVTSDAVRRDGPVPPPSPGRRGVSHARSAQARN
jgi:diguanylate cyclase (GGDEF)-like protein